MPKHTNGIKTERLVITPLSDEALSEKAAAEQDAHMRAAYSEMLDGCRAHPADRLWFACWLMTLPDGTPVGDLCFQGTPTDGDTELGYGVDAAYQNRGYATEAVNAMANWAFAASETLYYLMAQAEPDNAASRRVLEKTGFSAVGNGSEGILYRRLRVRRSQLPTCVSICMGLGLCIGISLDVLALGLCIGSSLGLCLGTALDAAERKRFATARAKCAAKYGADAAGADEPAK